MCDMNFVLHFEGRVVEFVVELKTTVYRGSTIGVVLVELRTVVVSSMAASRKLCLVISERESHIGVY